MTVTVFMGTPEFAVPSLLALLELGHEVAAVYTREDQPSGRGRRVEPPAVKLAAQAHGLEIRQPATLRDPQVLAELAALQPDLIVVVAFGLLLPRGVLELPRFACINVHGSLLPRHRGAAPIAAAILAGDRHAGVSIMLMDQGVDTGPVLSRCALPLAPDDTTGSLTAKLAGIGARLLTETLPDWIAGALTPEAQDEALATYAPRIEPRAGEIDWHAPGEEIARKVRAYQPWPSAFTTWRGDRLKLLRVRFEPGAEGPAPGTVCGDGSCVGVVTPTGTVWLEEVQLAGRRALPIGDFLRGAQGFIGANLASAG